MRPRTPPRAPQQTPLLVPEGILLVDKPAGWSSHDVVARSRRLLGTKKVGHAGTLDPMATGVLVLGVGKGTKLLTFLVGCDKGYTATIRLGQSTITDDAEGDVTTTTSTAGVTPQDIERVMATLRGPIEQVPSSVSAIKVGGVRSYAAVRGGQSVDLPARPVTVSRFDVLDQRSATAEDGTPVIDLDVITEVSSGTYIRALARDLGAALGVGGHLTALRRIRVGSFDIAAAQDFSALIAEPPTESPQLLTLGEVASAALPTRVLTAAETQSVGLGQRIPSGAGRCAEVAAVDEQGRLIAVLDETRATAKARVVFAPTQPH